MNGFDVAVCRQRGVSLFRRVDVQTDDVLEFRCLSGFRWVGVEEVEEVDVSAVSMQYCCRTVASHNVCAITMRTGHV